MGNQYEATKVAKVLRILGTGVLLLSAGMFLIQGWVKYDPIWKYYLFLILTTGLVGAGLLCALGLKESKGARALFGVFLAFVPIHLATLGAMLYGHLFGPSMDVPAYFRFHGNGAEVLTSILLGCILLIPGTFFGFATLARKHYRELGITHLLVSSILLLPLRTPFYVTVMILLAVTVIWIVERRSLWNSTSLQSTEGICARLSIYSTLPILIGRSLCLYNRTAFLEVVVLLTVAAFLFVVPAMLKLEGRLGRTLQFLSLIFSSIAWIDFAFNYLITIGSYGSLEYAINTVMLPIVLMSWFYGSYVLSGGDNYKKKATIVGSLAVVIQMMLYLNPLNLALWFTVTVASFLAGIQLKGESEGLTKEIRVALSGFVGGSSFLVYKAIAQAFVANYWLALAVSGLVAVVLGSIWERKHTVIKAKCESLVFGRSLPVVPSTEAVE